MFDIEGICLQYMQRKESQMEELILEEEYKPLSNPKNYYIYADAIINRKAMDIFIPNITVSNIDDHIIAIDNILRDGIETDFIHNIKNKITWGGDIWCELSYIDYWFNLYMWQMLLKEGKQIKPKNIYFTQYIRRKNIKEYIDKFILTKDSKIAIGNHDLAIIVADGIWNWSKLEPYGYYLANTINNEDNIDLMNACEEYDKICNMDFNNVPFAEVKEFSQAMADRNIEIIRDYSDKYLGHEHGLTNSFRSMESINPKQYREATVVIGTKSVYDKVYPIIINQSFSNGGINNPYWFCTEAQTARNAQIVSKKNVGDSGDFARLLGLNNTDTILNMNPDDTCMSQHFISYEIKTPKHLSMIKNRYYRYNKRGLDNIVDDTDMSMVGKTVLLHSPMTCAHNSDDHGICRRCYGDLYYTNLNINVGKYAAEALSSILTQTLLSAKHLLETNIVKIIWNPEFEEFMDIDINIISLSEDLADRYNLKKYYMVIDPNDVNLVSDEDNTIASDDDEEFNDINVYNEYITSFYIKSDDGVMIKFESETQDALYISNELNQKIRRKAVNDDGHIVIPLDQLTDICLFYIKINNNEISKMMNDIINVINKASVTESLTADQALQNIVDIVVNSGLDIDSVHLETILSNQISSTKDPSRKPNWNNPFEKYKMQTLNTSLSKNKSVIITMLYKDLHRVLYDPLTFKKNSPSFFDLFFMEQPQIYMTEDVAMDEAPIPGPETHIDMCKIVDKK